MFVCVCDVHKCEQMEKAKWHHLGTQTKLKTHTIYVEPIVCLYVKMYFLPFHSPSDTDGVSGNIYTYTWCVAII